MPSSGMTLANVVHDALRCQREAALVWPDRSDARESRSRSGKSAEAFFNLPSSRSASSARLGPTSPITSACGKKTSSTVAGT